jgi:hypothetical protein
MSDCREPGVPINRACRKAGKRPSSGRARCPQGEVPGGTIQEADRATDEGNGADTSGKHGFPAHLWTDLRITELFERKFDVSCDPGLCET